MSASIIRLPAVRAKERKYVSGLPVFNLLPARPRKKHRPPLSNLAQLIRDTHLPTVEFANHARFAASIAIRCAIACGGYLREAKASPEMKHGNFMSWVKLETGVEPRTARNYMRLHIWVCTHQQEILEAKPHSLRQFYILAGILPEDDAKKLHRHKADDLAKLHRAVRKVTAEASAHRGYAEAQELWRALEPLARLLKDVSTDTAINRKHDSGLKSEGTYQFNDGKSS